MATLEAFDHNSYRKSRRNSMLILASQLNLTGGIESSDQQKDTTSLGGACSLHHKDNSNLNHVTGREALVRFISALYGKLIFFLGLAFPVAQFFSESQRTMVIYNSFYLYLYWGSIAFIVFSYTVLLRTGKSPLHTVLIARLRDIKMFLKPYRPKIPDLKLPDQLRHLLQVNSTNKNKDDMKRSFSGSDYSKDVESHVDLSSKYEISEASHGSMYLKMGTVLFGIGSMVYSGLEFGEYFELKSTCSDILSAISPLSRVMFTFLQMYYIYLNSRVSIARHTYISCFGLMHILATNLCIWLNVLVEETKHTLHIVLHAKDDHHGETKHNGDGSHLHTNGLPHPEVDLAHAIMADQHFPKESVLQNMSAGFMNHSEMFFKNFISTTMLPMKITEGLFHEDVSFSNISHNIVKRMAPLTDDCRINNLLGDLVARSSPLLFPCTIEYSLLCAGVIYVMWANIKMPSMRKKGSDVDSQISHLVARKFRHLYSVDCARASRGLFMGIFILVLAIISLVLFIVLVNNEDFQTVAIYQANISEILIYSIMTVTCIAGMYQMRKLSHHENEEVELDNILLLVAQSGVYIFCSFSIVSGYFNLKEDSALSMLTSVFALTQATIQTLLILGGSQRACTTSEQVDKKPGRELVTFLLVCNLAMWAMNTFQTARSEVHPHQLEFFGPWAWTIISHISMPLAIFYRFHATVCLGEIWKKSYKIPHPD